MTMMNDPISLATNVSIGALALLMLYKYVMYVTNRVLNGMVQEMQRLNKNIEELNRRIDRLTIVCRLDEDGRGGVNG